jgi:hypothetical protein
MPTPGTYNVVAKYYDGSPTPHERCPQVPWPHCRAKS